VHAGPPLKDRRILALCPDWTFPSGGVRKIYRHVEVLNALGYRAFVGHQAAGFRCTWFESNAPIAEKEKNWPPDPTGDILVCPEFVAWQMVQTTPGLPKVIFNQGAYLTFQGMKEKFTAPPYESDEFVGTIVVSEDSRSYLNYAFPKHRVLRIHNAVDPAMFFPVENKRRQIAYMPRKMSADARQILTILQHRRSLDGFEVVAIENLTELQTAEVLRDSMIFLNFCSQEGCPVPPLEAMASGCLVIGYDGQGGREYLNDDLAIRVAEEDILGFVKAIEAAIAGFRNTPELMTQKIGRALSYVTEMHSPQRERQDIALAWQQLLMPIT
jgi:hypothetical protein